MACRKYESFSKTVKKSKKIYFVFLFSPVFFIFFKGSKAFFIVHFLIFYYVQENYPNNFFCSYTFFDWCRLFYYQNLTVSLWEFFTALVSIWKMQCIEETNANFFFWGNSKKNKDKCNAWRKQKKNETRELNPE